MFFASKFGVYFKCASEWHSVKQAICRIFHRNYSVQEIINGGIKMMKTSESITHLKWMRYSEMQKNAIV